MTSKSSIPKKETANREYAIVETSGTQIWIEPNRYYDLNRIKAEAGQAITLDKVLLFNDGKETKLGKPYLKGATVELKVLEHRRGNKILVYKMRPKKKTRRKNGHRQELTRVIVQSISLGKQQKTADKAPKSTKPAAKSAKTPAKPAKTPTKKTTTTANSTKTIKDTKQ